MDQGIPLVGGYVQAPAAVAYEMIYPVETVLRQIHLLVPVAFAQPVFTDLVV